MALILMAICIAGVFNVAKKLREREKQREQEEANDDTNDDIEGQDEENHEWEDFLSSEHAKRYDCTHPFWYLAPIKDL